MQSLSGRHTVFSQSVQGVIHVIILLVEWSVEKEKWGGGKAGHGDSLSMMEVHLPNKIERTADIPKTYILQQSP